MGNAFNYRGRRYIKVVVGGLSRKLAEEKVAIRRRESPGFLWTINKEREINKYTKEPTYSYGRASKR